MRHGHAEETRKQMDAYLTCTSEGMDMLTSFPAISSLSLKLNTALPASAGGNWTYLQPKKRTN